MNFSTVMSDYLADGWQAKFDENVNVSSFIIFNKLDSFGAEDFRRAGHGKSALTIEICSRYNVEKR